MVGFLMCMTGVGLIANLNPSCYVLSSERFSNVWCWSLQQWGGGGGFLHAGFPP